MVVGGAVPSIYIWGAHKMSEYTELKGTGKLSSAIRELQRDVARRTFGGPGVLVDNTTRGKIVRLDGRFSNQQSTAPASSVVPRWG